jgi:hypothetical protein
MDDNVGDAVLVQDRRLEMFKPFEKECCENPDVDLRVKSIPSRQFVVKRGSILFKQKDIRT